MMIMMYTILHQMNDKVRIPHSPNNLSATPILDKADQVILLNSFIDVLKVKGGPRWTFPTQVV